MDWFRMYGEFANDPKVQMMPEAMQRRLVMLFCLQCSNGLETFHETERETSIAFALRISEADLAETKELFLRKGFINSDWTLCNWDRRQYASDSSTARVRRHREKAKQANETHETFQERSGNALEQNRTDTEQITNTNPNGLVVVSTADSVPPCPHQEIIALYHQILPTSPAIRDWTSARQEHLRTRWKEDKERQNLEWWERFFRYIARSSFLTGKVARGDRKPFCPGLEWICKAENFTKIREGRYEDMAA